MISDISQLQDTGICLKRMVVFGFDKAFFLLFLAILLLTFLGMVSSRDLLKRLLKVTSNVARDEKVTPTEAPGCRCLMLSPD